MTENDVAISDGAERACEFVIAKVRAQSGHRYHQGPRRPPLPCSSSAPAIRFLAEHRLHRIPAGVARALVAWGNGFPVVLLTSVPPPPLVLGLQAEGRRCVSLLSDMEIGRAAFGASADGLENGRAAFGASAEQDALAFAVHDLCHLEKFIDPRHHVGQVGFFARLHHASRRSSWADFENRFDDIFRRDWQHVAADMNGSAVFLFAALKMKLKMAVRRRCARLGASGHSIDHGPLTRAETTAYETELDVLFQLLCLDASIADAARATSARRDDPHAATELLRYFEDAGTLVLQAHDDGLIAD